MFIQCGCCNVDVTSVLLLLLLFSVVDFSSETWDTLKGHARCSSVPWAMWFEFLSKSRVILFFLWLVETCSHHFSKNFSIIFWLFPFNLFGWAALPGALTSNYLTTSSFSEKRVKTLAKLLLKFQSQSIQQKTSLLF